MLGDHPLSMPGVWVSLSARACGFVAPVCQAHLPRLGPFFMSTSFYLARDEVIVTDGRVVLLAQHDLQSVAICVVKAGVYWHAACHGPF